MRCKVSIDRISQNCQILRQNCEKYFRIANYKVRIATTKKGRIGREKKQLRDMLE